MATQFKLMSVSGNSDLDYTFALNPSSIRSGRRANYSVIPIANHDFSFRANGDRIQWINNDPDIIELEFTLFAQMKTFAAAARAVRVIAPQGYADVENDIAKLQALFDKEGATGEPPDMWLSVGSKINLVRAETLELDCKQWTYDLKRQIVDVRMTLRVVTAYASGL